ncbi:hypothetical protein HYU14_04515 [Candidatus Woesearchaeota archaeon]|nr:hypothetical protein [Candidatus Woesearchaeota archaeon]
MNNQKIIYLYIAKHLIIDKAYLLNVRNLIKNYRCSLEFRRDKMLHHNKEHLNKQNALLDQVPMFKKICESARNKVQEGKIIFTGRENYFQVISIIYELVAYCIEKYGNLPLIDMLINSLDDFGINDITMGRGLFRNREDYSKSFLDNTYFMWCFPYLHVLHQLEPDKPICGQDKKKIGHLYNDFFIKMNNPKLESLMDGLLKVWTK